MSVRAGGSTWFNVEKKWQEGQMRRWNVSENHLGWHRRTMILDIWVSYGPPQEGVEEYHPLHVHCDSRSLLTLLCGSR